MQRANRRGAFLVYRHSVPGRHKGEGRKELRDQRLFSRWMRDGGDDGMRTTPSLQISPRRTAADRCEWNGQGKSGVWYDGEHPGTAGDGA